MPGRRTGTVLLEYSHVDGPVVLEGVALDRSIDLLVGSEGAPSKARLSGPCPVCGRVTEAEGRVEFRSAYDDMKGTEGYFRMSERAACASCGEQLVFGVDLSVFLPSSSRRGSSRTELDRAWVERR